MQTSPAAYKTLVGPVSLRNSSMIRSSLSGKGIWRSKSGSGKAWPASLLNLPRLFDVSSEVKTALRAGGPIVALETTIYTHGLPYPENASVAFELEKVVRKHGAVPATIGVTDGVAKIGLSEEELLKLCRSVEGRKPATMKVSKRDLPYILGMGLRGIPMYGGTTVSATAFLARLAGLYIFGTGGLGGVHRGGQDSMDVSADLVELGKTDIAVVASGCKSFLDIPRTLEYLETQGVMVATFADGREPSDVDFPAFYTRDSGVKSPLVIQNPQEAAAVLFAALGVGRWGSGHRSGLLFANPVPEEHAFPKADIDLAINEALHEAAEKGVCGPAITPFILARIKNITQGRSLPANIALVTSNVEIAAQMAVEHAKLRRAHAADQKLIKEEKSDRPWNRRLQAKSEAKANANAGDNEALKSDTSAQVLSNSGPGVPSSQSGSTMSQSLNVWSNDRIDIAVFGSVAVDLACDLATRSESSSTDTSSFNDFNGKLKMESSNIAQISPSIGGVGHNVALAAHLVCLKNKVKLCSIVGDDAAGKLVMEALKLEKLDNSAIEIVPSVVGENGIPLKKNRTAQYVAVNDDKKNLVVGMADMSIFKQNRYDLRPPILNQNLKWAVIDANWSRSTMRSLIKDLRIAHETKHHPLVRLLNPVKIAYEPVSVSKAGEIFRVTASGPARDQIPDVYSVYPYHPIDLATPNRDEIAAMYKSLQESKLMRTVPYRRIINTLGIPHTCTCRLFEKVIGAALTNLAFHAVQILPYIPTIITKLGCQGILLTEILKTNDDRLSNPEHERFIFSRCSDQASALQGDVGGVYMRLFPPHENDVEVVSVNGAGDTFLGVLIAGLAAGKSLVESSNEKQGLIDLAQRAAVLTLTSTESVSPRLQELRDLMNELDEESSQKCQAGLGAAIRMPEDMESKFKGRFPWGL